MPAKVSRREFLKLAALTGTGAALAACAPAAAPAPAPAAPADATQAPEAPAAEAPAGEKKKLIFSSYTWSGYEAAMRDVIAGWNTDHPDVEVEQTVHRRGLLDQAPNADRRRHAARCRHLGLWPDDRSMPRTASS